MASDRAPYREIEHTADLGIEITAADLPGLFTAAGEALYSLIADSQTIESREARNIYVTGDDPEDLLHAWLRELLALFNLEGFVGKQCEIAHISDGTVRGRVRGEILDPKRHAFYTEIKGVTYHDFRVWQETGGWHARIIFDV